MWDALTHRLRLHWRFLTVAAAFTIYALLFIYRTSFVIGGERYFSLFDDAMVSMRYAKNLVAGYGLVWNPGSVPIEGYTNPLWVIYMAGWHLLPISASKISLAIQLSALVFLVANLYVTRKIALVISNGSEAVALGATVLTAFYVPLNNWSLQGMEVSVLVLIMSVVVLLGLDTLRTGRFHPVIYILLAVSTLVRLDMAVLYAAVFIFLAFVDRANRRSHLIYGVLLLVLFVSLQTGLRLLYYGDLLPNTYYLKVEGFPTSDRILHGLYAFWLFASKMNLALFLVTFSILILRRDRFIFFLCWLFFCQSAYSIYVGGDAWEIWGGSNRFISIVMPLFMVLLSYSVFSFLMQLVGDQSQAQRGARFTLGVHALFLTLLLVLSVTIRYFGSFIMPTAWLAALGAWLSLGLLLRRRMMRWAGDSQPDRAQSGPPERVRPSPVRQMVRLFAFPVLLLLFLMNLNSIYVPYALNEWLLITPPLHVLDNEQMVLRALAVKEITRPNATFAVVWAGIMPYFADRTAIDLLGKNDRTIAHMQMPLPADLVLWRDFRPGHMKYDYNYSIGQLHPDIITQFWSISTETSDGLWADVPNEAEPLVAASYKQVQYPAWNLYVRDDSTAILWDRIDISRRNIDNISSK